MIWLEFIFKLIENFVPISTSRIQQLQQDGMEWYKNLKESMGEDFKPVTLLDKVKFYIKEYGEHWATQTALAVLFIFANRTVHDFMNPSAVQDDDDDRF